MVTFCILYCETDKHFLPDCIGSIPTGFPILIMETIPTNDFVTNIQNIVSPIGEIEIAGKTVSSFQYRYYKAEKDGKKENTFSFSDARNSLMKYAKTDWVFSLDPDESFFGKAGELTIVEQLNMRTGGLRVHVVNMSFEDNKILTHNTTPIRLFRNGFKYKYRCHEDIYETIANGEYDILDTTIILKHVGYLLPDQYEGKLLRNVELQGYDLAAYPNDAYVLRNAKRTIDELIKLKAG